MGGKMMILKKNLLLSVLFVSVIVSLVCAASLSATTGEVEITGVIFLPNSPDVEDMYPIVFAGEDGEMYAVSMDGKCVELIEHGNKLVKVIGIVSIDKNGGKSITVKHMKYSRNSLKEQSGF
jgi:hypothetical protein